MGSRWADLPVLDPDRQISMYRRLQPLRERYLLDALQSTIAADEFSLDQVNQELAAFAQRGGLKRLASFSLRGEFVSPVPYVILRNPFLLGYYRLLLGLSKKIFYEQGPFKAFAKLEDTGRVPDGIEPGIAPLCRSLCQSAAALVEGVDALSLSGLNDLQLLTLGAQLRGGGNVARGQKATERFVSLIDSLLGPYEPKRTGRSLVLANDSGLPPLIRFGSDPDVSITQKLESGERKLVAIEIKGGTDFSNVWNRLGEAEKRHISAKRTGFNELWTVLGVDLISDGKMLARAKEKSPATTRFFFWDRILETASSDHRLFRELLGSILGLRMN